MVALVIHQIIVMMHTWSCANTGEQHQNRLPMSTKSPCCDRHHMDRGSLLLSSILSSLLSLSLLLSLLLLLLLLSLLLSSLLLLLLLLLLSSLLLSLLSSLLLLLLLFLFLEINCYPFALSHRVAGECWRSWNLSHGDDVIR